MPIPKPPSKTPAYTLADDQPIYFAPRPFDNYIVGSRSRGDGNEAINGNRASDYIDGRDGDDRINGAQGGDIVIGGTGNDTLSGGSGDDQLFGGQGRDVLEDAAGNDTLDGGAGDDVFAFNTRVSSISGVGTAPGTSDADIVMDFKFGKDSVVLFEYSAEPLLFTQAGDDVVLTAGGNPVATFLDADAGEVAASTTTLSGFLDLNLIA